MSKSEVYSWRLSPDLKAALEDAARREGSSVAELLERMASRMLAASGFDSSAEELQQRLRAAAKECFGTIHGGDPLRSRRVRENVRARLRRAKA